MRCSRIWIVNTQFCWWCWCRRLRHILLRQIRSRRFTCPPPSPPHLLLCFLLFSHSISHRRSIHTCKKQRHHPSSSTISTVWLYICGVKHIFPFIANSMRLSNGGKRRCFIYAISETTFWRASEWSGGGGGTCVWVCAQHYMLCVTHYVCLDNSEQTRNQVHDNQRLTYLISKYSLW